jgi:hypothetical protein
LFFCPIHYQQTNLTPLLEEIEEALQQKDQIFAQEIFRNRERPGEVWDGGCE